MGQESSGINVIIPNRGAQYYWKSSLLEKRQNCRLKCQITLKSVSDKTLQIFLVMMPK